MGTKYKFKENKYIHPCPDCGNNTEFTIHSAQVSEDCCEIWAECKCGKHFDDPIEDVWGGTGPDEARDAIDHTWNPHAEPCAKEEILQ